MINGLEPLNSGRPTENRPVVKIWTVEKERERKRKEKESEKESKGRNSGTGEEREK